MAWGLGLKKNIKSRLQFFSHHFVSDIIAVQNLDAHILFESEFFCANIFCYESKTSISAMIIFSLTQACIPDQGSKHVLRG